MHRSRVWFVLLVLLICIQNAPNAPAQNVPATAPGARIVGGYPMPTLQDEKKTYSSWGWKWAGSKEPSAVTEPIRNYSVSNPDIHSDTEGDDLWTYLMMYLRTGNSVYLNRATAWARYFKSDYLQCLGEKYATYCYDRNGFGSDHLYGWGLLALFEYNGDPAALATAQMMGTQLEALYSAESSYGCYFRGTCLFYGFRASARHLIFMTRLADITGDSRWALFRDKMINILIASPQWDPVRDMYFVGDATTD